MWAKIRHLSMGFFQQKKVVNDVDYASDRKVMKEILGYA